jgi:hypothetical protein
LVNKNLYGICYQTTEEVGERQSPPEQTNGEGEPNGNISKPTPAPVLPVDVLVVDSTAGRSKKIRERPFMKSIQIQGSNYHCVN